MLTKTSGLITCKELLSIYRYGITYDLANKVIRYIQRSQNNENISINLQLQDTILSYANFNDYGMEIKDCGEIPLEINEVNEVNAYDEYGF